MTESETVGYPPVTPRQSASVHLPELAELHALTRDRFQAEIIHLVTPDGEWGTVPEWTRWPMVRGDEIALHSWTPGKQR